MAVDEAVNPRRKNMQANRRRDTGPERALRTRLHAAGLRYRCDLRLVINGHAVRPDIVFTRRKIAVFIDGCVWHQCPEHSKPPSRNVDYWQPKLERTRLRDARNTAALQAAGWRVLRFWEHEPPTSAAERVVAAYLEARTHAEDQTGVTRPVAPNVPIP